jgi:spore maturation protein SpmA
MLNYIWLALLFLGIGAALTTDIVNQNQNKYRNDEPISVTVNFYNNFVKNSSKNTEGEIKIGRDSFNSFYRDSIKSDLVFPIKITPNPQKNVYSIYFKINNSSPAILQQIASASGEKNDITGTVSFNNIVGDTSAIGQAIFEEVKFLKLKSVTNSALDYAGIAVNIAIGLIGIMALWLGVMKVAVEAGLIKIIANVLKPITKRLFPEVPADHPAMGSMIMNISANMLGLGNAATPFGLKAMEELEETNPEKGTATNAMCTFLAINTAGITLIPATAIAIRAAAGSSEPAVIIGTSLFASVCATIAGVSAAKIFEKFPIKKGGFSVWLKSNAKLFLTVAGIILFILLMAFSGIGKSLASVVNPDIIKNIIQGFSIVAIPLLIVVFLGYGLVKKVKVYEQFIEGAKEGFNIAVKIIPYLVAMLVAIGIFRAGGAMAWLIKILKPFTDFIGMPAEALPMALMRPLSGSGSLGIMAETISVHGPDSFIGIMVSTFYGSTETTFYVLALYFGAVSIKKTRHALPAGLVADIVGILAAVFIVRLLFG